MFLQIYVLMRSLKFSFIFVAFSKNVCMYKHEFKYNIKHKHTIKKSR